MNASAWEFIRAIRGPMMLIVFGTLTALNHTNRLDFERSWPVLIIVYGLLKLLERIAGGPVPPPNLPPSWQQQTSYPVQPYTPPQYPPVYPPPQSPQGGAQ